MRQIYRQSPIKECFTNVKQVFLLYHWGSLVTLELISLIPLVGSPEVNPLAVKLLDNRLFMPISFTSIALEFTCHLHQMTNPKI